jgi:hypothetical protein
MIADPDVPPPADHYGNTLVPADRAAQRTTLDLTGAVPSPEEAAGRGDAARRPPPPVQVGVSR